MMRLMMLCVCAVATLGCESAELPRQHDDPPLPSEDGVTNPAEVGMPKHEIIETEVTGKWVKLHAVVGEEVTETKVRRLLKYLYTTAQARRVAVYIYPSKEHYKAEMGQWLGMLVKGPADSSPRITIQEDAIASTHATPEERIGLSEKERMQIWRDNVIAEDQANLEVEAQYPVETLISKERMQQYSDLSDKLTAEYRTRISAKYGLTEEQLQSITAEGVKKNWPFPRMERATP